MHAYSGHQENERLRAEVTRLRAALEVDEPAEEPAERRASVNGIAHTSAVARESSRGRKRRFGATASALSSRTGAARDACAARIDDLFAMVRRLQGRRDALLALVEGGITEEV